MSHRSFLKALTGLLVACLVLLGAQGRSLVEAAPAGAPAGALPAVFATGGEGRFKDSIQWLQCADYSQFAGQSKPNVPVLDYGQSRSFTNYRDMGEAGSLITTCTLSDLTFHGHDGSVIPQWLAQGPLVATIPSTWAGDVLDNLYNVGGPATWRNGSATWSPGMTYPQDYTNRNQMVIGLANGYAYNGNKTWNGKHHWEGGADRTPTGGYSDVSVSVSCSAELRGADGTSRSVPLNGLVFADAEASSAQSTGPQGHQAEWVQAAVAPGTVVSWRLLDRMRSQGCPTTLRANFWENRLIRLNPSGDECVYHNGGDYLYPNGVGGPAAVVFMEGATEAELRMQGGGYSAVALGLVIATDFGDAPASYGTASSLFQPTWNGGELEREGMDLFTEAEPATMTGSGTMLGHHIDSERGSQFSDGADADDAAQSPDDEDGVVLPSGGIQTAPGQRFTQEVICTGAGRAAGWVDWNHNGAFDAAEKSDEVVCPEAPQPVPLTWTVPQDVVRSVDGEQGSQPETYMRVRVSADDGSLQPTGTTASGEVEDYRVAVRVPTIELVKEVGGSYAGDLPLLPATAWTLTAQGGRGTAVPNRVQGEGRSGITVVGRGTYTLSETSTQTAASGYEAEEWVCFETDGTVRAPRSFAPAPTLGDSLRITGTERMTCTVTNQSKSATLTWQKVDEDGVTPLGGSRWMLAGPGLPAPVEIEDCVEAWQCQAGESEAPVDLDPAPGGFRVEGRVWGVYTMTESQAPQGYTPFEGTVCFNPAAPSLEGLDVRNLPDACIPWPEDYEPSLTATVQDGEAIEGGKITNRRDSGSVTWKKTGEGGTALGGSFWTLTGPPGTGISVEIADCVTDPGQACPAPEGAAYYDSDPAKGSFRVTGLPINDQSYRLMESEAPAGYSLDRSSHTFTITAAVRDHAFTDPLCQPQDLCPLHPTDRWARSACLPHRGGRPRRPGPRHGNREEEPQPHSTALTSCHRRPPAPRTGPAARLAGEGRGTGISIPHHTPRCAPSPATHDERNPKT
ncbi:CshA/CshB family fibrillar adhesin-related protein [Actinomyces bowdenii]|uniref:CshA/CshB family fibrillar adhesin-related protein n=1 Tax=Actinomyces bowdenii TaxID=131109 RepID=UPI00214B62CE|nr:CshA/CshB family fibrillar adhesin-related protein [Actinomyces bowdenii]MCR2052822.1 CshA/CshB family fibrillar adhesin-related protein [Actinomyces bowdenii]